MSLPERIAKNKAEDAGIGIAITFGASLIDPEIGLELAAIGIVLLLIIIPVVLMMERRKGRFSWRKGFR